MNRYSETSKSRLSTCHRDLQTLFNHVVIEYDNTIVCGYRGEKEQNEAFSKGNSQLQFPKSKHNHHPSLAVDAAPFENTGIDWSEKQCRDFAGYVLGVAHQLYRIGVIKHRIRRGVDWNIDNDVNDNKFDDLCHFEIILNEEDK